MPKPDPVELVATGIIHLAEAVAVILFIGMLAAWAVILATPVPACRSMLLMPS